VVFQRDESLLQGDLIYPVGDIKVLRYMPCFTVDRIYGVTAGFFVAGSDITI
jgi:hypothetical protein